MAAGETNGAVTPRERHRLQTHEEILDAALAVMAEQGVAALNLTEVARRVGLRQPSLYQYFDSRTAVYDALFERGWRAGYEILAAAINGHGGGWAAHRHGGGRRAGRTAPGRRVGGRHRAAARRGRGDRISARRQRTGRGVRRKPADRPARSRPRHVRRLLQPGTPPRLDAPARRRSAARPLVLSRSRLPGRAVSVGADRRDWPTDTSQPGPQSLVANGSEPSRCRAGRAF